MDRELIRAACLALPGATESVQWGNDLVFKVGGKMFAVVGLPPSHAVSFKCSAEAFYELQERSGVRPAPYLARAQWLLIEDDGAVGWPELKGLLEQSYAIVWEKLPKSARSAGTPSAAKKRAPKTQVKTKPAARTNPAANAKAKTNPAAKVKMEPAKKTRRGYSTS
jgi:predicted DNA-binding protein (MmcQ/YjbR family)